MTKDDAELIHHLMAKLTAMLEDAAALAVRGQNPHESAASLVRIAGQIDRMSQDIGFLSKALTVLVGSAVSKSELS